MITAAASSAARAAQRARRWLSVRHSLRVELLIVVALYGLYETTRGLAGSGREAAVRHAADLVSVERSLHLFVEADVQRAAERIPGLVGTLGFAYLVCHLALTGALLVWLHRRRPAAYPFVRTTFVLASALALVGYLAFPTAPPRLSGVGILDTVTDNGHVNLNAGLVSSLYNPYAAVPSMHAGYALIVGATLVRYGRRTLARLAGIAYPVIVMLVILATGNHFLLDAVAGGLVAGLATAISALLLQRPAVTRPVAIRRPPEPARERLAA